MTKFEDLTASELLGYALQSLDLCEQDPRYQIDMDDWHGVIDPNPRNPETDLQCSVCLAGAFLAECLGFPIWVGYAHGETTASSQMEAINYFRTGYIISALETLDIDIPPFPFPEAVYVPSYEDNPTAFKSKLWRMVSLLKEYDL